MHIRQRSAARAFLLDARRPCRLSQHPALGDEHDVAFGELFLELPREPEKLQILSVKVANNGNPDAPGMNLTERLELGHRDKDHDGLFATPNIDLSGRRNLQRAEVSFEFGDASFEVNQSLSDLRFCLIRGCSGRIGGANDFTLDRHIEN